MQRGVGNVNPMKMAKCIKELERIYGIKEGNNQYSGSEIISEAKKSQEDLANQIGIDERQLQRYKKLNELIPELQSLVEVGDLKSNTDNLNLKIGKILVLAKKCNGLNN